MLSLACPINKSTCFHLQTRKPLFITNLASASQSPVSLPRTHNVLSIKTHEHALLKRPGTRNLIQTAPATAPTNGTTTVLGSGLVSNEICLTPISVCRHMFSTSMVHAPGSACSVVESLPWNTLFSILAWLVGLSMTSALHTECGQITGRIIWAQ